MIKVNSIGSTPILQAPKVCCVFSHGVFFLSRTLHNAGVSIWQLRESSGISRLHNGFNLVMIDVPSLENVAAGARNAIRCDPNFQRRGW